MNELQLLGVATIFSLTKHTNLPALYSPVLVGAARDKRMPLPVIPRPLRPAYEKGSFTHG
jgi:hypothetical protein